MATTPAPTSLQTFATTAEGVVEGIMKVEPTVATIASMFVPGAAPIVAMVQPEVMLAAPFIENALKSLAAGNNGDVLTAFIQLLQHITPGQPNASLLDTIVKPSSVDPSTIGSA
jgi:hypothetical protein